MKKWVDFRSDTVTHPTDEMRKAMFEAEVGDDVYGDDPTVNRFEQMAANILGKEAALFVPSGTMGNQLAVLSHTSRGGEVILGDDAHMMTSEVAAIAVLSGCQTRPVHFSGGIPDAGAIKSAIREDDIHKPITQLICLENALGSGKVIPVESMREVYETARKDGIPVHLDGARVFNAAISLGVDVKDITACCDSVMACVSKGLCAPIGSILAGSREFIDRARKNRKMLGGGLRQSGILAAAGIIAITDMVPKLKTDHDNAKYLSQLFSELPGVSPANQVDINIVFLKFDYPYEKMCALQEYLLTEGIKIRVSTGDTHRFLTNHDTTKADIERTASLIKYFLEA